MAGKKKPHGHGKKRGARIRRKMLSAFDLPMEVDPSVPHITMAGRSDLLLENHTGVLQCTDTLVRLTTHEGVVCITGAQLALMELTAGRAYVRGQIEGVSFEA